MDVRKADNRVRRRRAWLASLVGAAAIALVVTGSRMKGAPRTDRDWAPDHAVQAIPTVTASSVRIDSIRDFRHGSQGAFTTGYRTESFDLSRVRGVWFVLAPFTGAWSGLAHTFVSFELDDGRFLAVSVEARREVGESYSLVGGLTHRFEVTYVIGTEEDLLGLRALRGDVLYLYPSNATRDQARAMLADMLARAGSLQTRPEFYDTLTNNCATNLRDHVNGVIEQRLPFGWGVLFPGYSDKLALERGLLATDLPLEAARQRYRVDELVREALAEGGEGFSERIRLRS
jgi:hypothetical protein